jgi:3-phenylpropionate/cinnamic acid dioxygenase small subunit
LAAWLELFTDDAHYWIPARRGPVDPDRLVSIVYDDKPRLAARVARLLSGKEYAQEPPSVTCRQLSNLVVVRDDGSEAEIDGVQVTYETRPNTAAQVLPSHVTWRLRRDSDGIRITSKRVLLVDLDRYYENLTFII